MKTESLLHQTRIHFPRLDVDSIKITPIEKGGSDRRFYRVHNTSEHKLILVKYNLEREENRHYVEIAKFLEAHDIRAPKIYYHDAADGLIWIEDLGEEDLFSYRREDWQVRRGFYESALDEAAKLHRIPERESRQIRSNLPAEFNAALYLWEQGYFFTNCLGRCFGVEDARLEQLSRLPALKAIAEQLAGLPRVLVHRDFQSQNIIIRNDLAYLIDFQGMRPGLAEYDVASLVFDPYVELADTERTELIDFYIERQQEVGCDVRGQFDEVLPLCGIQRLMQALGAYGFLGLEKKRSAFLKYIPRALEYLFDLARHHGGLDALAEVLARAIENGRQLPVGDAVQRRKNIAQRLPIPNRTSSA